MPLKIFFEYFSILMVLLYAIINPKSAVINSADWFGPAIGSSKKNRLQANIKINNRIGEIAVIRRILKNVF